MHRIRVRKGEHVLVSICLLRGSDERGVRVTPYREVGLSLDPFAIIIPKIAPRHKLSSQHGDGDRAQEEPHDTPEPNLDFRSRVRFLRSNLLPSSESFVSFVLTCNPFIVFLLLFVPILLIPDNNENSDHRFEGEESR